MVSSSAITALMELVSTAGTGFTNVGTSVFTFITSNVLGVVGVSAGIFLFCAKVLKRLIPFI